MEIGDTVSLSATVRRRVTEDRISVSIPGYGFPHSIVDSTTKVKRSQTIELQGEVLRVDEDSVTVDLSPAVTVPVDKVKVVQSYVVPKRKRALVDREG